MALQIVITTKNNIMLFNYFKKQEQEHEMTPDEGQG
jgi:hypothetical protein